MISIVTPAFNEKENLPLLFARLGATFEGLKEPWEWIIVDDHSSDGTFEAIQNIKKVLRLTSLFEAFDFREIRGHMRLCFVVLLKPKGMRELFFAPIFKILRRRLEIFSESGEMEAKWFGLFGRAGE